MVLRFSEAQNRKWTEESGLLVRSAKCKYGSLQCTGNVQNVQNINISLQCTENLQNVNMGSLKILRNFAIWVNSSVRLRTEDFQFCALLQLSVYSHDKKLNAG